VSSYTELLEYLREEEKRELARKEDSTVPQKETPSVNVSDFKDLEEQSKTTHNIRQYKVLPKSKFFDVTKLEDLMRDKLTEKHRRMQTYERPYISVTELYTCLRKVYYSRMKFEIDLSKEYRWPYLYFITKVGNVVHDLIQELYPFSETEKSILIEKFRVKGRIDGLINKDTLVELKTIDDNKFKYEYIKEHYYQGLIYAYILNSEYGYKIRNITLVYIVRTLKAIHTFDLKIDNELAVQFLNYGPMVLDAIETNTAPEPINSSEQQCKFCQYHSYCKEEGTKIKKEDVSTKKKRVFLL